MPGRQLIQFLRTLALVTLVAVFSWSGVNKIVDPQAFSLSVFRYHLLPYEAVNIAALWLAGIEVLCAVLLLVPRLRNASLWMILLLLVAFSISITINLLGGSHMACGCFSTSPMAHPIGWLSLFKNAGLMLLCVLGLRKIPAD